MIGLDTNVLVRYFTQDDTAQAAAANRLIAGLKKESPGFVSLVVLCELVWVLEEAYGATKPKLLELLGALLESDELQVESKPIVWAALEQYRAAPLDFSDALIAQCSLNAGCVHTVTFDRAAAKSSGFMLLKG